MKVCLKKERSMVVEFYNILIRVSILEIFLRTIFKEKASSNGQMEKNINIRIEKKVLLANQ
jgi:hypothetical protein